MDMQSQIQCDDIVVIYQLNGTDLCNVVGVGAGLCRILLERCLPPRWATFAPDGKRVAIKRTPAGLVLLWQVWDRATQEAFHAQRCRVGAAEGLETAGGLRRLR